MAIFNITSGTGSAGYFNSFIESILTLSDKVVVFGDFTTYRTESRNRFMGIGYDGLPIDSFNTNIGAGLPGAQIYSLFGAIYDGDKFYFSGYITNYDGNPSKNAASANSDGTWNSTFAVGATGFDNWTVTPIKTIDNKLIYVGRFALYQGVSTPRIVKLNLDGTRDTSLVVTSGFNNAMLSVHQDSSGNIYVCGYATAFNGNTMQRFCKLSPTGAFDSTFETNLGTGENNRTNTEGPSMVLDETNGRLVAVGNFTTWNGATHQRLVALNLDGTVDNTFTPSTNTVGQTYPYIHLANNSYFLERFVSYNGVPTANGLMKLNTDGSIDTTFMDNFKTYLPYYMFPYVVVYYDNYYYMSAWNNLQYAYQIMKVSLDGTTIQYF